LKTLQQKSTDYWRVADLPLLILYEGRVGQADLHWAGAGPQ
jgi:hypothetical protein